ncbi:recombination-associated protein RdgC [Vibrio parahaemolyticus]|nr:recombination-associated protein RdgC [Vibrio parahaemolyticus]
MFFKNLVPYTFTRDFALDAAELEKRLKENQFVPCGDHDSKKIGWVAPTLKEGGESLVHAANGCILIAMKEQEKLLPPKVVKEMLEARVEEKELELGRTLKRKEKSDLKDDIIKLNLPKAFVTSKTTYAVIMPELDLLFVNATNRSAAEKLTTFLRKTIGSLPVSIPTTKKPVSTVMTEWLRTGAPEGYELGDKVDLMHPVEGGGTVKMANKDLAGEEVAFMLEQEHMATVMTLKRAEVATFTITEDLLVKGVTFESEILDQNDDIADDKLARFDADFDLMCRETSVLFASLVELFGGLEDSTIQEKVTKE